MSSNDPTPPSRPAFIRDQVSLAAHTTLGVGGPAAHWADCDDDEALVHCLQWARQRRTEVFVLGGGSNLLAADQGFHGLVVRPLHRDFEISRSPSKDASNVIVQVGAGWDWDRFVARTVDEGWAGVECLAGIPGRVGAAPIQNIGAYGQDVSETIRRVRVMDRRDLSVTWPAAESLGFGYRHSRFKADWRDRFVVTAVEFELRISDRGTVRYPGLRSHLGLKEQDPAPSPREIRRAVLDIRRRKSMVLDSDDPNRRSAGSFFVNPVISKADAEAVQDRVSTLGIKRPMPQFPAGDRIKLSAAWLIEEAGFKRGHVHGQAGLSSRHTLALINRGGAEAREILDLSWRIRHRVEDVFGVELRPEPVFLGLQDHDPSH